MYLLMYMYTMFTDARKGHRTPGTETIVSWLLWVLELKQTLGPYKAAMALNL